MGIDFFIVVLFLVLSALNCYAGVANLLGPKPSPRLIAVTFAMALFNGLGAIVLAILSI